ncbi:hypothetical protein T265_15245, partial [Opisthorchis viverrini]
YPAQETRKLPSCSKKDKSPSGDKAFSHKIRASFRERAKITQTKTTEDFNSLIIFNNGDVVIERVNANIYHAYYVLGANKIPAENIITFAYDDIAKHLKNPVKGKVFNDYEHEDVYKGVVIDYRGKANIYHAYYVLGANKIPAENIITFAYDDIAKHLKNPVKGKVFNDYEHEDVYKGVVIDYRGKLDKAAYGTTRFLQRLTNPVYLGNIIIRYSFPGLLVVPSRARWRHPKPPFKTTVTFLFTNSGPDDNIFIYYTGHDGVPSISFPSGALDAAEFSEILVYMYANKMYKHMVLYMDARFSGSIFHDILPSDVGITRKSNMVRLDVREIFYSLSIISRNYSNRFSQLSHVVKETFHDIVMDVATHHKRTIQGLSKRDELTCYKGVFDQFQAHCFTIQQVVEVIQYLTHLMELRKAGYEAEILIESFYSVCS